MAAMTASGGEPAPVANPGDAQLDTDVPQQPPPPPRRDIDRGQAQKAEPDAHPVDKSLPVPASGGQATSATASAVTETPPPGTLLVYTAHVTMAVYQVDSAIDAVEAIARGVAAKLLHDPIVAMKERNEPGTDRGHARLLAELFGLDPDDER